MNSFKYVLPACLLFLVPASACAQSAEESTVDAASSALQEIMAIPAKAIPRSLLSEAHGVAIVPGLVKGGFVVGARHGKGVVVTRDASGAWSAPQFITVTGGSIGFQAGIQATDVIVVFRNRRGVEGLLMRGKFTIGADAAVAAGPIGREASAATDAQLKAEILSYSRSRGLFLGVAIDGAALQIDHKANAAFYAAKPGQPASVPASAIKLVEQIAAHAGPKSKTAVDVKAVPTTPPAKTEDVETIRGQLAESAVRLQKILEPQWQEYLALPAEVFTPGKTPAKAALDSSLARFNSVAKDPRYQSLFSRAEFQETHVLMARFANALENNKGTLKLPPPPRKDDPFPGS